MAGQRTTAARAGAIGTAAVRTRLARRRRWTTARSECGLMYECGLIKEWGLQWEGDLTSKGS